MNKFTILIKTVALLAKKSGENCLLKFLVSAE